MNASNSCCVPSSRKNRATPDVSLRRSRRQRRQDCGCETTRPSFWQSPISVSAYCRVNSAMDSSYRRTEFSVDVSPKARAVGQIGATLKPRYAHDVPVWSQEETRDGSYPTRRADRLRRPARVVHQLHTQAVTRAE